MKKIFLLMALFAVSFSVFADDSIPAKKPKDEGFVFTTVKEIPITSVKDQHRSSTCWSFSTMAFFEAEILREKKINVDLAEMYLVSWSMRERGELFVRLHGNATFSPGGAFADGIALLREGHGVVPQSAMPGLNYAEYEGDTLPVHKELDAVARGFLDAIVDGNMTRLTPAWKRAFADIYKEYLGECPEKFMYEGKEYTPQSFQQYLGLNPDDYISLTSFTHHPFYSQFSIEIEDNWRNSLSYNLPIDEFMETIRYAVDNGYTVAWGADVTETGFSRQGVAVVPDAIKSQKELGSDMAHWFKLSKTNVGGKLTTRPLPELEITQEMRQQTFDNWETTDDHGMLIYGIAKDQNGKDYFLVKNSWGDAGKYHGIWYVSEAYVKYKTMNVVINKKALPKRIAKKLGIK